MRTTLFVAGFGSRIRARDLAYEFERYGRLVRCDIPAPKTYSSKPYAFVEFEDPRDADDAFNEMHGRRIDGYTISVQWARNAPSASWRYDRSPRRRRSPSPRRPMPRRASFGRSRSRSRSPYRGGLDRRSPSPRGRSPPPPGYEPRRPDSRSRPLRGPEEAGGYPLPPRSRSRSPLPEPPRRESRSPSPRNNRTPSRSPEH
ncbi:uncharacterized protein BYT42DRAFT_574215 [Radiomyces spectabilis]|uniref:uncharacterized protein n=1 Tax=Radiomyces spectabilis TaxID=64574 RepID=UPI0022211D3B|nr:uncharacterized protein BYT42DRAFT_574215 [Radiomyces spectabilis]KAI8376322.1 hypothetical protein BYT42DRAFT_574215 [Radiomyces spectabilis]